MQIIDMKGEAGTTNTILTVKLNQREMLDIYSKIGNPISSILKAKSDYQKRYMGKHHKERD